MGEAQRPAPVDKKSNAYMAFAAAATGLSAVGAGLVKMDINEMGYGLGKAGESAQWARMALTR